MALTWDITRIKDHKAVCYRDALDDDGKPEKDADGNQLFQLQPLTEALIWATITVDLGEITEDNYREFAWRLRLYTATTGNALMFKTDAEGNRTGYDPTEDEVKAHIGLKCNVCDLTTAKYMAKLRRIWKEREQRRTHKAA
jgi:hypothetical protein